MSGASLIRSFASRSINGTRREREADGHGHLLLLLRSPHGWRVVSMMLQHRSAGVCAPILRQCIATAAQCRARQWKAIRGCVTALSAGVCALTYRRKKTVYTGEVYDDYTLTNTSQRFRGFVLVPTEQWSIMTTGRFSCNNPDINDHCGCA